MERKYLEKMKQEDFLKHLDSEKEAIQNCENDPLFDIGYIQPFGYLLAKDVNSNLIVSASENTSEWFGLPINKILGSKLSDILPREVVHQCNNSIAHSTISSQREFVGRVKSGTRSCDIYVHLKQDKFILELQPTGLERSSNLSLLDNVHRVISRIKPITDQQLFLEQTVDELRAISGFHRVKAYRFLSDGAGEVAAESREPQIDSYLGLRFPAADIPKSARKLYETTPIRIIPSVTAAQVPILSIEKQEPLDLSLALYRGLVKVHSLYLSNMGVNASLSLPITINGQMWGLFAFHHMEERMLDSEKLASLEILGGSISMILNSIINQQRILHLQECTRVASSLFVPDDSALGFSAYWDTASSELATLINCDGVGLLSEGRFDTYGNCPREGIVRRLCSVLDNYAEENDINHPMGIDSIESKFPDLDCGDIAGVLAIPNPAMSYKYLLYFRKDASKVVRWAGNPSKDLHKAEDGFRLSPRASFSEYQNSKQKQSDPFSGEDLIIADSLRGAISRMMSTITVQTQHRERLGLVIRELNHRVRNMLALVGSIITQSRTSSHNIEEFIQALEQRLQALSETQKLLTEYDWKNVNIRHLFERALLPYHDFVGTRLILMGDDVSLPPSLSSLLALIMNELASNALKYGALSDAFGKILVSWLYKNNTLSISWVESEGPRVPPPTRHGFGTTLIREALLYEFGADCKLDFIAEGVEAHFSIPVKEGLIEKNKISDSLLLKPLKPKAFVAIVLEDDYIIAKEMASILESLGATKVDTVPSIESAIKCINMTEYDIGFLDANIRGEFSGAVAELLEEKGIPFVFATGYGSKDQELRKTPCIDILSKPVSKAKLLSVLKLANLDSKNNDQGG